MTKNPVPSLYSRTEENYLKEIFHLTQEQNVFTVNELSLRLNIKMPSVISMMNKFATRGWVEYVKYKPLKVTDLGLKEAAIIVRKHRLTEMYLVEKMGLAWEEVHSIAEQLEHIKSEIFFDKMDELLGYPNIDPHGEPIPDKNGKIIERNLIKLSDCKVGDEVVISSVTDSSNEFLAYLNQRELALGSVLNITNIEKYDNSMSILFHKETKILSKKVCDKLLVKKT